MRKLFCDGSFYSPEGYKAAMLVEEGRIARLYDEAEPLPQELERVPLGGAWVYPAFCDTHTHCFEGGLYSAGADLSGVKSITDLLDLLREALRELQRGETLFAWKFDESAIREARFPSQAELDKLTDDKSIVLRRIDGHSAMLNARARAELGAKISSESVLRGADNDTAVHHFHHNQSEDAILRAYHKAAEIALKGGFGSVHTMIGDAAESITHYGLIHRHLSHFAIDYVLYPQSFNLEAAMAEGAKRIGGCILADGSIGSRTAALSLPYEGKAESGALYRSDSFWQGWVKAAHEKDLQVAVHCIGDRAIRQINEAYRLAQAAKPGDFRHQLIHCELCTDELLDEIAASGACAVMQPAFDRYWGNPGGLYERVLGQKRARQMNRFASMLKRGIKLCFGSDWYITELDAIAGIHAAVNHHNEDERIGAAQAIEAYTLSAAWLAHEERSKGSLEPGKWADFSLSSHDLLQPFEPEETRILGVYRRGAKQA